MEPLRASLRLEGESHSTRRSRQWTGIASKGIRSRQKESEREVGPKLTDDDLISDRRQARTARSQDPATVGQVKDMVQQGCRRLVERIEVTRLTSCRRCASEQRDIRIWLFLRVTSHFHFPGVEPAAVFPVYVWYISP